MADGSSGGEPRDYSKEWAEYYAKMGYTLGPQGYVAPQAAAIPADPAAAMYSAGNPYANPYGMPVANPYAGGFSPNNPYAMGGAPAPSSSMSMGRDGQQPSTTIWVGNVNYSVSDQDLHRAFGAYGRLREVKILREKSCAFIRFIELDDAINAHRSLQGLIMGGQQVRVGWGKGETGSDASGGPPPSTNLYIGNVDPNISEEEIRIRFQAFGQIERINILPEKSCAFVNFTTLESALEAKRQLSGANFGGRSIRINFGKGGSTTRDTAKAAEIYAGFGGADDTPNTALLAANPSLIQPPAPIDESLKKIIDQLAATIVKSGPQIEEMLKVKQAGNPKFAFLNEGQEYYDYYKWKIFDERQRKNQAEGVVPSVSAAPGHPVPAPPGGNVRPSAPEAEGPPLAPEEKSDLSTLLDTLTPTQDSIKRGKDYIMARPEKASHIAAFICHRIETTSDFTAKLNMIYLINDVLHHSHKSRRPGAVGDVFCDAVKPYIATMMWSAFHNQPSENQAKVVKMLHIWKSKGIYNAPTIMQIESIVTAGVTPGGPAGGRGGLGYQPAPAQPSQPSQPPRGPPSGQVAGYPQVSPPGPPMNPQSMMSGLDDLLRGGRSGGGGGDDDYRSGMKRPRSSSPGRDRDRYRDRDDRDRDSSRSRHR